MFHLSIFTMFMCLILLLDPLQTRYQSLHFVACLSCFSFSFIDDWPVFRLSIELIWWSFKEFSTIHRIWLNRYRAYLSCGLSFVSFHFVCTKRLRNHNLNWISNWFLVSKPYCATENYFFRFKSGEWLEIWNHSTGET